MLPFSIPFSKSDEYFTLTGHLSLEQPHFRCPLANHTLLWQIKKYFINSFLTPSMLLAAVEDGKSRLNNQDL